MSIYLRDFTKNVADRPHFRNDEFLRQLGDLTLQETYSLEEDDFECLFEDRELIIWRQFWREVVIKKQSNPKENTNRDLVLELLNHFSNGPPKGDEIKLSLFHTEMKRQYPKQFSDREQRKAAIKYAMDQGWIEISGELGNTTITIL